MNLMEAKKIATTLKRERRAKSIRLAEVAEQLNLRTDIIKQIESGNWQSDAVFLGFVRSYASLLKVDISQRPMEHAPIRKLFLKRFEYQPKNLQENVAHFPFLFQVVALVLVVLVYAGWQDYINGGDGGVEVLGDGALGDGVLGDGDLEVSQLMSPSKTSNLHPSQTGGDLPPSLP